MKAGNLMNPRVLTVRADAPIGTAPRLMLQNRISGLPVVDAQDRLVGIVTEGDFLRRSETETERRRPRWLEILAGPGKLAEEYVRSHGRKVEAVMTREVVAANEATPLDELVRLMERHRVKRLPVLRDGKIVGIVSRADLLHAPAGVAAQVPPPAAGDSTIRERILAELAKRPWAPIATVTVSVKDGVVELTGTVTDDRERAALKVAAENVAGVKAVRDQLLWVEPMSGTVIGPNDEVISRPGPSMG